ncbi:MAG: NAD(P)H-hydrate dehydratase [Rubrivivax sp.]|nr:MAG: NAD(P)H-hydrate dehydratase [Rubrivivax sp.]
MPSQPNKTPVTVDAAALQAWPLPLPSADGDKEERGRVLLIAGSREMPGAAILAANAALRAGVGKLTLFTVASVAQGIALAVPEARVVSLPDDPAQWLNPDVLQSLQEASKRANAVLVGPGMQDEPAVIRLTEALLPCWMDVPVVLDAAAMNLLLHRHEPFRQAVLLTPHAGEMAHLTGMAKEVVRQDAQGAARSAAQRWGAVVALKGACTVIVTPEGLAWRHDGGNVGLAVSGSGDTLAGLIAGLAARGASLPQAAAWGVALHARAGEQLARRWGLLGYLAREIADEVPGLIDELMPG